MPNKKKLHYFLFTEVVNSCSNFATTHTSFTITEVITIQANSHTFISSPCLWHDRTCTSLLPVRRVRVCVWVFLLNINLNIFDACFVVCCCGRVVEHNNNNIGITTPSTMLCTNFCHMQHQQHSHPHLLSRIASFFIFSYPLAVWLLQFVRQQTK